MTDGLAAFVFGCSVGLILLVTIPASKGHHTESAGRKKSPPAGYDEQQPQGRSHLGWVWFRIWRCYREVCFLVTTPIREMASQARLPSSVQNQNRTQPRDSAGLRAAGWSVPFASPLPLRVHSEVYANTHTQIGARTVYSRMSLNTHKGHKGRI